MGIRTFVEFNNDYLDDLEKSGHISEALKIHILSPGFPRAATIRGVKIWTTSFHDTEKVTIDRT